MDPIYKIMSARAWQDFRESGTFAGTDQDRADGYIHFSTAAQLAETLFKHYRARTGLVLLAIDMARLDPHALRLEPARGGQLFPHLYAPLRLDAVLQTALLACGPDGRHILPDFVR
ncbi:MAG: DUF952 domain-containing protein [Rhodothalassiaceae bacterium]